MRCAGAHTCGASTPQMTRGGLRRADSPRGIASNGESRNLPGSAQCLCGSVQLYRLHAHDYSVYDPYLIVAIVGEH